tara:strand:- start:526 stop:966 length:441 start_codon:yes stop_codon:yes gene_type:complete
MQVILLESLNKLGKAGEVVNVKDGYAKNYLIPQSKAIVANKSNLKDLENRIEKINDNNKKKIEIAESLRNKINENVYQIEMEANEEGILYGSVTPQQIIKVMGSDAVSLMPDFLNLPQMKTIGDYIILIKLYEDIEVNVTLSIVRK